MKKEKLLSLITGGLIGIIAVVLVLLGNPGNMGFCIACFIRDTVGALKLHSIATVQYIRPEIIGLILGSTIMAIISKEFRAKAGSNPLIRFILGFFLMIGALVFLGCPLRMMLRIGAGDLNAVVGLVGFIVGIFLGILALNKGFSLNRSYKVQTLEGAAFPVIQILLLIMLIFIPTTLSLSEEGPGAMRAPIIISLILGLIVGGLCQKSRFCTVAGIRDTIMFKDSTLLIGFIALIACCAIMNIIVGKFNFGFMIDSETTQPIAHTDSLWNFLGMTLVGFTSALLGGCPLRQLVLSGEGNVDSSITILGMAFGAAFSHNFNIASSAAGTTVNGHIAVIFGVIVTTLIAVINIYKNKKEA